MTIAILLVPANLKVHKEALNSFIESNAMLSEFVPLEVVLEIRWSKPTPIDHGSSCRVRSLRRRRLHAVFGPPHGMMIYHTGGVNAKDEGGRDGRRRPA